MNRKFLIIFLGFIVAAVSLHVIQTSAQVGIGTLPPFRYFGNAGNLLISPRVNTSTPVVVGDTATSSDAIFETQSIAIIELGDSGNPCLIISNTNGKVATSTCGGVATIIFLANGGAFLTTSTIDFQAGSNITITTSTGGTYTITGSAGGSGTVTTSSAVTANFFPFWTSDGVLSGTSTIQQGGSIILIGGDVNVTGTITASGNLLGKIILAAPEGNQTITTSTDQINAETNTHFELAADTDYLMISTPTIADGSDGQLLFLHNESTSTITLQDEGELANSNIKLGSANGTIRPNSVMSLLFDSGESLWFVLSNPNTAAAGATADIIQVRNTSGGTLFAGKAVYITGFNVGQNRPTVGLADADDLSKIPAIGLVASDIGNNKNGEVIMSGSAIGLVNTSAASVNDGVWLSTTAGELVFIHPTTDEVQRLGTVTRANANGNILITGAGRVNDISLNLSATDLLLGITVHNSASSTLHVIGNVLITGHTTGTTAIFTTLNVTTIAISGESITSFDNDLTLSVVAGVLRVVNVICGNCLGPDEIAGLGVGDFATTSVSQWTNDSGYLSTAHATATIAGEDYLSLVGQEITANAINPDNLAATDFGDWTCDGTTCTLDEAYSTSTGSNPTATVGLSATNGTANTFMRSDGAPALNVTISPSWTGAHDYGGATSIEIVNSTSPTVDAAGEIAIDITNDQFIYFGTAKRVLSYEKTMCGTIEDLFAADDNMILFTAPYNLTLASSSCKTAGYSTEPTISLEDDSGNAVTGAPICTASTTSAFYALTSGNTFVAGEGIRFDVTNTPVSSTVPTQTNICLIFTIDAT